MLKDRNGARYRVAQWGTGNVGMRAMQAVIEHPWMDLVAARVYSDGKEGVDAGTLCGLAPIGITATRSIEHVIAARPDCTIYMPDHETIDDMCRLLESGSNIVTGVVGFNHRDTIPPEDRARLEAACAKGGSSLFSTGSIPGWASEILPYALMMKQRRFDCLTITDFADSSARNSPLMLFDYLGFGRDLASIEEKGGVSGTARSTPPTFRAVGDAIGLPIDEIRTTKEYAVTRKREIVAAGTLEPGTVGAIRMGIIALHKGRPVLQRFSIWYLAREVEPQWDIRDTGMHVQVKGDTSLDITIEYDVSAAEFAAYTPGLTAHPIVNALPFVCDAPPGLLETADMPMLVPYFGEG